MTFLNNLARGVGYCVMLMCLIGAVTPMKFTLRLTGPDVHIAELCGVRSTSERAPGYRRGRLI